MRTARLLPHLPTWVFMSFLGVSTKYIIAAWSGKDHCWTIVSDSQSGQRGGEASLIPPLRVHSSALLEPAAGFSGVAAGRQGRLRGVEPQIPADKGGDRSRNTPSAAGLPVLAKDAGGNRTHFDRVAAGCLAI